MKKLMQRNGNGQALIYCRVSTARQEDEGTSLDSQADACVSHAKSLGYMVGRITKEVFSGAELFDRPKLSRDRADIHAGLFQAVIVYAIDRLSRNIAHLAVISEECERAGCRLLFVTEELDNTAEGKLLQSVKAYVAEVEREKIRERTLRGRHTKLKQGRPVFNGWELYGYRPDRAASVYTIHEPEATVVRRIFSMCAEGHGMHSIASTLNREAVPSPKADRLPGARWTSGTICRMLNDRSYMGEEIAWTTKRVGKRDITRPESEWVRMPDGIRPAIISRELWEACQQNIRTNAGAMTRNKEYPTLLRGHIFCAECGARMIRNYYKRGKYEYLKYRCGSRWRPFKTDCKGLAVVVEAVHKWAWTEVKSILLDPNIIERSLNEMEQDGPDPQLIADLKAAKKEYERTERGIKELLSRFRASAGDTALWPYIEREIAQAAREKQQLDKTIIEIETRISEAYQRVADLRQLHDYCALVRENLDQFTFDEQRLALRALGLKVYANGDDSKLWRYEVSIPVREPDDVKVLHAGSSTRL